MVAEAVEQIAGLALFVAAPSFRAGRWLREGVLRISSQETYSLMLIVGEFALELLSSAARARICRHNASLKR